MGYPEAQYVIDELTKNNPVLLSWINDYKNWGEKSYVFNIPEMLDAVYMSREGVNDLNINIDGIVHANSKGGTAFNDWLHNLESTKDQADTLYAGILTIDNLLANENLVISMINDPITKQIFLDAVDFYENFLKSTAYMEYLTTNLAFNKLITEFPSRIETFKSLLGSSKTSDRTVLSKTARVVLPEVNNTYYYIDSVTTKSNVNSYLSNTVYLKTNLENSYTGYPCIITQNWGSGSAKVGKLCKSLSMYDEYNYQEEVSYVTYREIITN